MPDNETAPRAAGPGRRPSQVAIIGGGAAGFFAAITCAEAAPGAGVILLEKGAQFLSKVRISGGGRCNVTHACFDPRELVGFYPRGGAELLGAFHRFQPRDTTEWFEARGVALKIEADGRVFPVSDSSRTIIDCLLHSARARGVELRANCDVADVHIRPGGGFVLTLPGGEMLGCDRLMLATGGCRGPEAARLPLALGHTIEAPVPSLFTFQVPVSWLRELAGVSVASVEVSVPGTRLRARGAMLTTHAGLSGPAILRVSAWGARELHAAGYTFPLRVDWAPEITPAQWAELFQSRRVSQGARLVINSPAPGLSTRLWARLVQQAGVPPASRWAGLSRPHQQQLIQQLTCTELQVTGKSLNREEFVTCGGVRLREVHFQRMESRLCPGLYFGGELLDIDGLTGGFNFQAAWTTGWIAGRAMGASLSDNLSPALTGHI